MQKLKWPYLGALRNARNVGNRGIAIEMMKV